MKTTYIIGHQKPDTDAVVAPMGLEYLYKNWSEFGYANPEAVITDPLNPETAYLFEKFGVKAPRIISSTDITPEDEVVLADHNEVDQRITGLQDKQIVEIVDHHKVNLNFSEPIYLNFKPWGSTSTIVYYLMKKYNVKPTKELASLLLAAILSDTVGFKSPTTTAHDTKMGMELAQIAEISDLDGFTLEIFKAKSDVSKLTTEQIIKNDYKIFDFGKKTFIDQLETVEQDNIITNRKADLLTAMQAVKAETGVELLFVAITDILKVNTKLIILSDAEAAVAEKAFGGKTVDNVLDIGAKLSRKKEIAPPIEIALK